MAELAERQQWSELQLVVERRPGAVSDSQPDGMTALHWAAEHRQEKVVDLLLKAGADPNAVTRYGIRPLAISCLAGDWNSVVRFLKSGSQVDARGPSQETALMIASRLGHLQIVRSLVDAGADVDATDRSGQSALMWAAAAGHTQVVKMLVVAGAAQHREQPSGFNAFFFAVRGGHIECVEALIELGCDVNQVMNVQRPGGRSPARNTPAVALAVENGHFELALRLVELGADPNDQRSGLGPLHLISLVRKPDRGEDDAPPVKGSGMLNSLDLVRALVHHGADVNLKIRDGRAGGRARLNSDGATPILYAAKTADTELMKLLVELGADIHSANSDGCTPLLAAAGVGVAAVDEEAGTEPEVMEALEYLSSLGAAIDSITLHQDTAMHGAAFRAYPKVIAWLHQQGLKSDFWNRKDAFGWSPFDIADGKRPGSVKPNPEVRKALIEALQ